MSDEIIEEMQYMVVREERVWNLRIEVSKYLKKGWLLQGGIFFDGYYYIQAMTKNVYFNQS